MIARPLTADDDGDVFFSSSAYLFEYDVPAPAASPCTRELDESGSTDLVVADGEVVCGTDVEIRGGVTVSEGGTLRLERSKVRGELLADGAAAVRVAGTRFSGSVTIRSTIGEVVFSGNEVRGTVSCGGNNGGVDDLGDLNEITGAVAGCALR